MPGTYRVKAQGVTRPPARAEGAGRMSMNTPMQARRHEEAKVRPSTAVRVGTFASAVGPTPPHRGSNQGGDGPD
jgi:hypothetical protein